MDDLTTWRWLISVIDMGGLRPAAQRHHRSVSTVSHAIKQLEQQLGVTLVETEGRRLVLTEAGAILLERVRPMLAELDGVNQLARQFGTGIEPELSLAVDQIVPPEPVHQVLEAFGRRYPETRIELFETVLGGGPALIEDGAVDLYVGASAVPGFRGQWLMNQVLVPCAAEDHPLNRQHADSGRPLTASDLRQHRQIVIRDSDPDRLASGSWLQASQRITVDHLHTALRLIERGIGFAWMPKTMLADCRNITSLPLSGVAQEDVPLSLFHAGHVGTGAAERFLHQQLCCAFGVSAG